MTAALGLSAMAMKESEKKLSHEELVNQINEIYTQKLTEKKDKIEQKFTQEYMNKEIEIRLKNEIKKMNVQEAGIEAEKELLEIERKIKATLEDENLKELSFFQKRYTLLAPEKFAKDEDKNRLEEMLKKLKAEDNAEEKISKKIPDFAQIIRKKLLQDLIQVLSNQQKNVAYKKQLEVRKNKAQEQKEKEKIAKENALELIKKIKEMTNDKTDRLTKLAAPKKQVKIKPKANASADKKRKLRNIDPKDPYFKKNIFNEDQLKAFDAEYERYKKSTLYPMNIKDWVKEKMKVERKVVQPSKK